MEFIWSKQTGMSPKAEHEIAALFYTGRHTEAELAEHYRISAERVEGIVTNWEYAWEAFDVHIHGNRTTGTGRRTSGTPT
jgi:hypothetical protein